MSESVGIYRLKWSIAAIRVDAGLQIITLPSGTIAEVLGNVHDPGFVTARIPAEDIVCSLLMRSLEEHGEIVDCTAA